MQKNCKRWAACWVAYRPWKTDFYCGRAGERDSCPATHNLGGGGGWHKALVFGCLPLAVPIGLSPLLILTLCGSESVLVVSTEPPDDLSCLTTPGVGCPGGGPLPVPLTRGIQMHTPSPCAGSESSTALCALGCASVVHLHPKLVHLQKRCRGLLPDSWCLDPWKQKQRAPISIDPGTTPPNAQLSPSPFSPLRLSLMHPAFPLESLRGCV